MHLTELANRLATFGVHFDNMDGNYDEAKRFVRLLNGSYEKFNMPTWLQGEGLAQKAGQILFNTFRTHVQNTYEIMGVMMKEDRAAFAYSMTIALAMAGVPAGGMLELLMKTMYGGEEGTMGSTYLKTADLFGETVADIIHKGAFSVATGLDVSGSLQMGNPPPIDAINFLTGNKTDSALVQPFKQFYKGMISGELPWYKGFPTRAAQSILTAVYEGEVSPISDTQVTVGKRNIFNSDGSPMTLSLTEQFWTGVGINPIRRSGTGKEIWEGGQIKFWLQNRKSDIINAAKSARGLAEKSAVNKQMKEFNDAIRDLKRNPTYRSFVKSKPISWKDTRSPRNSYTLAE